MTIGRAVAAMRTSYWSDLPEHLLAFIAKRLDAEIDILRFRAVCSSWRSSVPHPNYHHSSLPLKLPFPISPTDRFPATFCSSFALTEQTVYLFQLPGNDGVTAGTHQASSRPGWLVRVREEFPGRLRVFSPLSKLSSSYFRDAFIRNLNNLNLLNFRVTEVSKVYELGFLNPSAYDYLRSASYMVSRVSFFQKVILSGNSVSTESRDRVVVAIQEKGSLCFLRLGDEKWTVVPHDGGSLYRDVLVQNDYFYAVDKKGDLFVFDNSFKIISTIASAFVDDRVILELHLVKSVCDILLVVRCDKQLQFKFRFKVYKLNEKAGNWTELRDLGDRALFVGEEGSWSVSAQDCAGCKGNCIYFSDIFNVGNGSLGIGVFNLEDGTRGPLASYPGYSNMFRPPPLG